MPQEFEYIVSDQVPHDHVVRVIVTTGSANRKFFLKNLCASTDLNVMEEDDTLNDVTVRFVWTPHESEGLLMCGDESRHIIARLPNNKARKYTAVIAKS